jgi:glycosyltransferase involved in cell wall biosynthesis
MVIHALIAAFNESAHVAEVVAGAAPYVSRVIVIDDGSDDDTGARASAAGAVVLRHDRNLGKGRALRTGIDYALRQDCTHLLFLDADNQHDPAEIPRLIAAAEEGVGDFVIGEREFNKQTMPAPRFYSNVVGSAILSRFVGARVNDSQSGFRLIRCDLVRRLRLTGTGYEIETEMLIKLVRAGATVDRVTVRRLHYAGARSKIHQVRDTTRTCFLAVWYRYLSG